MTTKRSAARMAAAPARPRSAGLCTRWIITLVVQGKNNKTIRAALLDDDLPCPSDTELDGLRAEFVPRGFKLKSPKGAAVLKRLGIECFFKKNAEAEEALRLLREPRVRELVEAGLIIGVPVKAVTLTLQVHLKREVSPAAIDLYRSVFFDVSVVMRAQLRVLVHARVRLAVMRAGPEDEVAARRAIAADARSVAASLSTSAVAWSAVLMAAGYSPGRRELADVIAQMESVAVVRASEAMLRGERDDERRAEAFVGVLQKLHQIRENVVTPESDVTKKLTAFRVKHDAAPMTTAADLRARGEDMTVDMGPPLVESEG